MALSDEDVHAILSRCPRYSRERHLTRALAAFDMASEFGDALLRTSARNLVDAIGTPDDVLLQVSFDAFMHEFDEQIMLRRAVQLMTK